jgi:hypothetical protein
MTGYQSKKAAAQRTWVGSGDLEDSNAYQTPPAAQRTWVGLTDDEIQVVLNKVASEYQYGDTFAKAIEAELKEKNT